MLKFSKMHGLGNDFVVIDAINQSIELTTDQIRFLANRHQGVGCDQLLLVENSQLEDVDFRYRIFNADGSEVAQCGNGARCFARFVRDKKLTEKDTIAVETASGIIYPTLQQDEQVTVDMGMPHFSPDSLPFNVTAEAIQYDLSVIDDETITLGAVSMGNPHAVLEVENSEGAELERLGPIIESHTLFPERVNVGFMQIITRSHIMLRVYERGAGETQACGTGACAAVAVGIKQGKLDRTVRVSLPGGDLMIMWPEDNYSLWMTGPATHVFDGEIAWATINNR
ncbi:MAG: diaminopimelate epimerase [Gammaproteobacteria bacterium]|nr:MAG: diaminopimelate epimerase [Gammaproteobacteria bacterium]